MTEPVSSLAFLSGGGEMGRLIRSMDWSRTSLGPPEHWPQSLRTTLGLCLASNFPLSFIWGPERIQFYNDGYWPLCGDKHPHSMGQDYKECWLSAWPVIGANFERCVATGETTFVTDTGMFLDRSGYLEETFFTYSYSPIRDESGTIAGVFHPVTETTRQVLAERRLRSVRALANSAAAATSVEEALVLCAASLAGDSLDLPFALLYRSAGDATDAVLVASAGLGRDSPASPTTIRMADGDPWGLASLRQTGGPREIDDLPARFGAFRCGPYEEAPHTALAYPISVATDEHATVFLIAGVSARRALDEGYRDFFAMLQDAVATAATRAHSYAEARRRAEALAELDHAKTDFFSNVSHEFRTPLTLMLGPLQRLLGDRSAPLSPQAREQLDFVHRNAQRLERLVNTLLDFSRTEAGRAQAQFLPVDLATVTDHLCGLFRSAIESQDVEFKVECEPLSQPVYVDPGMWESIVLNLVSNAFKFTLKGSISVRLRADGANVRLEVADTGCGIPAGELTHIFERFHRVRGAIGRSVEGTGIGLALVQDMVRLHRGSIAVESSAGTGTVFSVRIPLGMAHLPAEQVVHAAASATVSQSAQTHAAESGLRGGAWALAAETAAPVPPQDNAIGGDRAADAPKRRSILLADDNADMRAYVLDLLGASYDVRVAADGKEALDEVRRARPDLVLTDVMMPRLDGFGLVAALRADPATASVPVIVLSARAGPESSVEGLDAGADDYLVKPFSAGELRARVKTHIDLARLRQDEARRREHASSMELARLQAQVFDTALSNTADFVYTFDLSGRFTYANRALLQLWRKSADEAIGRNFFELGYPPQLAERLQDQIQQVIATRAPVRDETPYTSMEGARDYEYILVPVISGDGEVVAVAGSTRDMTERRQALEQLRENDRRKDEFLAMLAHELRNPLSAVGNAVAVLTMSTRPESVKMATQIIQRQVKQFARLIDDLLDVARITSGKIRLQREEVDATDALTEAAESVRPSIEKRRQSLTVAIEPGPLLVRADPTRFQQIVINLLANAAKYTPVEGAIELSARREGAQLVVAVKDNGQGIPPDKVASMFELFAQGEAGIDRSDGGLGIGLTIVQRLVELHGGTVQGDSDGPGRGSTFTVRLPAVPPALAQAGPRREEPATEGAATSVMVVDDNLDAAASLAAALRILGHEVHVAHDGDAALRQAEQLDPKVVLLDIGLPGMDGYQVASSLRSRARSRQPLIVAVSGYGQDEDRRRSAAAGFDHHLVKPVDLAALVSLIGGAERAAHR